MSSGTTIAAEVGNDSQDKGGGDASEGADLAENRVGGNATIDEERGASDAPEDTSVAAKRVRVHLRAAGGAPMLRRTKFEVPAEENVAFIVTSLRRQLRLEESAALFLYVNGGFIPQNSETLGNLLECFGVRGVVVFNYALQVAWG